LIGKKKIKNHRNWWG